MMLMLLLLASFLDERLLHGHFLHHHQDRPCPSNYAACKEYKESKEIFLDFWNEPANSPRRGRPGIYHSHVLGEPGKRVQFRFTGPSGFDGYHALDITPQGIFTLERWRRDASRAVDPPTAP